MINHHEFTIALVAGEISGDILGAGLIRALKRRANIRFVGIAGSHMKKEGCEAWYEIEELSVIGISEVISKIRRLLYIRADLIRRFITLRPDVFIGIDSPDFNLSLENSLKQRGIKTVHYVSPSIWAWRKRRIFTIKQSTNLVLLLFPFEKLIYEKFNVPYCFVGHTMADSIPLYPDKSAARKMLNISQNAYCLALLPGSRISEIRMLSVEFLKSVQILRHRYPDIEVIVPLVNEKLREEFQTIQTNAFPNLHVRLLDGKSQEALMASDIALLASGTATLECMLAKCPMVVGYRITSLTFFLVKYLIKTNYIALPNLLARREVVKEFLQKECSYQKLSQELLSILTNLEVRQKMFKIFRELHKTIQCNANEKAADAVLALI